MKQRELQTCYYAVLSYRERLQTDLHTKYNGDPNWSVEDETFLDQQIDNCNWTIEALKKGGLSVL